MKLNLGSNNVRYAGFLNVDIRKIPGVDIVDDVFKLETIPDNSVEHIIAHNILEHIAPDKTLDCLKLWVSKLQKSGIIEIGVPDGELIFNNYRNLLNIRPEYIDRPWENVIHSIFGNMKLLRQWHGEDAEKYMHHTLFCESYLSYIMQKCGLINIRKTKPNHMDNITLIGERKKIARKVVYTCIIGNYDVIHEVKNVEKGVDYICFSDRELTSATWKIVKIENVLSLDNSRFSKHPKILPHLYLKDYDVSVWVDGNIEVQGNIHEFLNSLNDTLFHVSRHPSTNCIYKEAQVVVTFKVADPELVKKQINKYRQEGYPENNGLIAGGVIVRNHNDPVCVSIDEQWWQEILNFSKRDQLSFNYVVWKNPDFKFEYIKEDFRSFIMNGKYFKYLQHLPKQ